LQPSDSQLRKLLIELRRKSWPDEYAGVAALNASADASGPAVQLRFDKKQGAPARLVPEEAQDATLVEVKRVTEFDYYSLSPPKLAQHLNLTCHVWWLLCAICVDALLTENIYPIGTGTQSSRPSLIIISSAGIVSQAVVYERAALVA
jgi:hypothetical protein